MRRSAEPLRSRLVSKPTKTGSGATADKAVEDPIGAMVGMLAAVPIAPTSGPTPFSAATGLNNNIGLGFIGAAAIGRAFWSEAGELRMAGC